MTMIHRHKEMEAALGGTHRHETVAELRECEAEFERYDAEQARAEAAWEADMEARVERFFEEGPESFQAARYAEEQMEARFTDPDLHPAAAPEPEPDPEPEVKLNSFGDPLHDTPCVCSVYDRCNGVRADDARRSGNWRDRFRAYND